MSREVQSDSECVGASSLDAAGTGPPGLLDSGRIRQPAVVAVSMETGPVAESGGALAVEQYVLGTEETRHSFCDLNPPRQAVVETETAAARELSTDVDEFVDVVGVSAAPSPARVEASSHPVGVDTSVVGVVSVPRVCASGAESEELSLADVARRLAKKEIAAFRRSKSWCRPVRELLQEEVRDVVSVRGDDIPLC